MRLPGPIERLVDTDPDYADLVLDMTPDEAAMNFKDRGAAVALTMLSLATYALYSILTEVMVDAQLDMLLPGGAFLVLMAFTCASRVYARTADRTILLYCLGNVLMLLCTLASSKGFVFNDLLFGVAAFAYGTLCGVSARRQFHALAAEIKHRQSSGTGKTT